MHQYFEKLKQNLELNDSFDAIVATRHAAVRNALENIGAAIKDTRLIGSFQRKTRIQPREEDSFDIDILVVLGSFNAWLPAGHPNGISSSQALDYVLSSVHESDRYSPKNPEKDAPTITLEFADGVKIELVPAYIDNIGQAPDGAMTLPQGRGYWIPRTGEGWMHADYDFDADFVSRMNIVNGKRLVPAIKMLKAVKRLHFPALRSFALEVIASQTIPLILRYLEEQGQRAISDAQLLKLFFVVGKDMLTKPMSIPGSNSPAIVLDAATAGAVTTAFDAIVRHIDATESLASEGTRVEAWRTLFGEVFPARVQKTYERALSR